MEFSYISETELPGKQTNVDNLQIIAHRYYWTSQFVAGKEVLEVACGPGFGLGFLANRAKKVIGGDITPECLSLAGTHYGSRVELVGMDAHHLPFGDGCLDVVVSVAAIIYMDLPVFLRECARVLKPEGVLILNMPNQDAPGFSPSGLSRNYYSVCELSSLLSGNFETELFGAFPVPDSARRFLRTLRVSVRRPAGAVLRTLGFFERVRGLVNSSTQNVRLPEELTDAEMRLVQHIPVVPLPANIPNRKYRIVYALARRN